MKPPRFEGIFPVAPTTFTETGELDLPSQRRCIDFMIDSGVDGICILANYSEQFSLSDDEREQLTRVILEHVSGRVPVIVTTSHFASGVCSARSRRAQDMGAAMVMAMPPYHGASLRVADERIHEFLRILSDAISIPIMIQDAPMSGTTLSVPFLVRAAREIANVKYFKIETPGAASKLRELIAAGGEAIEGPWDGEEAITLLADLDAGATGTMPGGGYADLLRPVFDHHRSGNRELAVAAYERVLPLVNFENRQAGLLACKSLMKEGGVIDCDRGRHPLPLLAPQTRSSLLDVARRLDPLVLRWTK